MIKVHFQTGFKKRVKLKPKFGQNSPIVINLFGVINFMGYWGKPMPSEVVQCWGIAFLVTLAAYVLIWLWLNYWPISVTIHLGNGACRCVLP